MTSTIPALNLLGWGNVGIVYQASDQIVVKRRLSNDDEAFLSENRIFDLLESNPQCPNFVRSFDRTSSVNFMQFVGDNLETRLQRTSNKRSEDPSSASRSLIKNPEI